MTSIPTQLQRKRARLHRLPEFALHLEVQARGPKARRAVEGRDEPGVKLSLTLEQVREPIKLSLTTGG